MCAPAVAKEAGASSSSTAMAPNPSANIQGQFPASAPGSSSGTTGTSSRPFCYGIPVPNRGDSAGPVAPSLADPLLLQAKDFGPGEAGCSSDCKTATTASPKSRTGQILGRAKDSLLWLLRERRGALLTADVSILYFNIIGWMGCYGLFFVSLQDEFGGNATETGWVGSLAFILNCLCTPISDLLRRWLSHRAICVLGILFCSISLFISSFMPQLCYMFVSFSLLYGLGSGLAFKSCLDLLMSHFPDNCGRVSFLVLCGSTAGTFAWTPINMALIDQMGWRNGFRICSPIILITSLVLTLPLCPAPPWHQLDDKNGYGKGTTDKGTTGKGALRPELKKGQSQRGRRRRSKDEIKMAAPVEKRLLCMPEAWLFGLGCYAPFLGMGFFNVNLVSYSTSKGFSSVQGATVMTIVAATEAGCKLALALFVDSLPFRKVHLTAVLSALAAAITLSCAIVTSFPILCVVAVGVGLVKASMNSLPFPVGMEIFGPAKTPGSNTLVLVAGGLGTVTSAFVVGGTFDALGSYNAAIYICSGCFLLTAFLFTLIPLTSKLYKVTRVKVNFDEVTGAPEMVPVVEDEFFLIEELVTVV